MIILIIELISPFQSSKANPVNISHLKCFSKNELLADSNDSLALVSFFNSTNGNRWINNTNWLKGNLDTWFGIILNDNGQVVKISLPENDLEGTIPKEIGNLVNLQHFNIYNNHLNGKVPEEIGNLKFLDTLIMSNNALNGEIPLSIFNLKSIVYINLMNNSFVGTLPSSISGMDNIRSFCLANNQIEGMIPDEMGNLKTLEELDLANNKMTGIIPSKLSNLSNLLFLDLSGNQFAGNIPPELISLQGLNIIYLFDNELDNITPISFRKMLFLSLQNNKFSYSDIIPILSLSDCFKYAPQKKHGFKDTILLKSGENYTITANDNSIGNQFSWYKNNKLIEGETHQDYQIKNFFIEDTGKYNYLILNAEAIGLSIESEPIEIVKSCSIELSITDGSHPIIGAICNLEGYESQTTNSQGIALFNNVFKGNRIPYRITASAYVEQTGIFEINNVDTSINIHMVSTEISDIYLESIKIYPNPTNGKFIVCQLEDYGSANFSIFNPEGKMVFSSKIHKQKQIEIDLTQLPKGIYFLSLRKDKLFKNYPIIVQ